MEMLFGKLPEFFKDEAELRALWCVPDTRAKLLQGLAEKGFGSDQLAEMQKIIDAEKSDLFDVLAYVAYALPTLTRDERATNAKEAISTHFNTKLQAFLDFVLAQYVKVGVHELDKEKLSPLLKLKYNAIADAVAALGGTTVGSVFEDDQKESMKVRLPARHPLRVRLPESWRNDAERIGSIRVVDPMTREALIPGAGSSS